VKIELEFPVSSKSVGVVSINGLPALEAKKAKGQPCPLSIKQREQLSDYIDKQSRSTKGGRLTGKAIRAYISKQFQINYHPNAVYKLLHRLGFSWITRILTT
jgi:transposase